VLLSFHLRIASSLFRGERDARKECIGSGSTQKSIEVYALAISKKSKGSRNVCTIEKKGVAQEGPYPFGHVRSTYLNLLLHNIGRLIVLADAYRGEGGSTYQVADNDLAFSSSGKSGADNCSGGGGSSRLASGVLRSGGVLGDTSSRDSGLVTTARATGVVAASAGNLLEGLVKLGRHCVCVCFGERCVSYEREKLATV
jgi:hypothetical protein